MFEYHTPVRFYLGANTPVGFVGYLEDLYDAADGWQAYIIKSGPGTGKASLMRTVLSTMAELGEEPEADDAILGLISSTMEAFRQGR